MATFKPNEPKSPSNPYGYTTQKPSDIMAAPKPIWETRINQEAYQEFANLKSAEFQGKFALEQAKRESGFKQEASLKKRYFGAKEKARQQVEVGSDLVIMGRVQKKRQDYFSRQEQDQVNDFNRQTEALFSAGKAATQKQIADAQKQFEYQVQVGSYTELSQYNERGQRVVLGYSNKNPTELQAAVAADMKFQEEQFKLNWESTGGTYADYSGNLISSMLSPSKIGKDFVKIGDVNESDQGLLKQRAADIKAQIKSQEDFWKSSGGTYLNPYGNLISSNLSPDQINVNWPSTGTAQVDYFANFNQGLLPFANVITKGKPFVGGFVKLGNADQFDYSAIEAASSKIINEAKLGYTKSYFNALANPQYVQLTPEEIAYNNTILSPNQIVGYKKPVGNMFSDSFANALRVQGETETFLRNDEWLNKYVFGKGATIKGKKTDLPWLISEVAGTGEFYKSMGGELFRNYVLQLKASPGSVGAIPFGMNDFPEYNQKFTRKQIENAYQWSYTTGRIGFGAAGYFTPAAPAFAAMDIAQARTPMEVIEPILLVGATTAAVKGGIKLFEYGALKSSALLGGNIVKAGEVLQFSSKVPQYLEYLAKGSKYVAPVVLAGYGAYSFSQSTPYLYSSDKAIAREAERRLFVSLGAGYVGGVGGDYLGTEVFEKNLNWRIGRETILQGGSGLGKLSAQDKQFVNLVFERAYGKQLPGDVQVLYPLESYSSKNLKALDLYSPRQAKAIAKITDQTIRDFAGDLYIGGSSQVPTQITGGAYKKAGDIDIFLGNKEFAVQLAKNINAANIKGVGAQATFSNNPFDLEGGAHVNLLKNGKTINEQFVNIHYDLSMTKAQLTKFGEMFQTTEGAFITAPEGYKLFNIREQLRAKIEGFYFGSRAKDLVDITGIMKGTEKAASLYADMKAKSVWLDERAMFNPSKISKNLGFDFSSISTKSMQEAYSPYANYSLPSYSQVYAFTASKNYYGVAPKDYYKALDYIAYKPSYYAKGYSPSYSAIYSPKYAAKYNPNYVVEYAGNYSAKYNATYNPSYAPSYAPRYAPKYAPSYYPNYSPKYRPKYYPGYTQGYSPPYTPKNPPMSRKSQESDSKYFKRVAKAFTQSKTKTFKGSDIANMILPIKTDWLKAIGYSGRRAKIQTIGLLPSKRKGSKQISRLLGFNFDKLF